MKLRQLFAALDPRFHSSDEEISAICFDSRELKPGCLFVAIRGSRSDGHQFLRQAVAKGARALVVEESELVPPDFSGPVVIVPDARTALTRLASAFYGRPSENLICIGVTGTNGKTTITNVIEALFNRAGRPTGVIGTIDAHVGDKVWPASLTTPDAVSLQRLLLEFSQAGAQAAVMEVSSIGLVQGRSDEVAFDTAIFTNLTRDHLDYHGDIETYFQSKRKLFTELLPRSSKSRRVAIINGDDVYGQRLLKEKATECWSYGLQPGNTLQIEPLQQDFSGTRFRLKGTLLNAEFRTRHPGLHNVFNSTAAIGAGIASGIAIETMAQALSEFTGVRGRLQPVENTRGLHVFVDYAHTDDALDTVLRSLRDLRQAAKGTGKIITVFGCGGDRDRGKRPLMLRAAVAGSDLVILTSDNPRTEDPQKILQDALAGAPSSEVGQRIFPIVDRREAIAEAIHIAKPGDAILIAGKGHEDYQQIGLEKIPFSDAEVAKEFLR